MWLKKNYLSFTGFMKNLMKKTCMSSRNLSEALDISSMKQARYSEKNIGHFGLAFEYYTHFTSPIRRYPDLVVHRILKKIIKGRYSEKDKEHWEKNLPENAAHTSMRERNAMEAEREIVDLKKTQFIKDKIGEIYNGIISGVTSFGLLESWRDI